VLGCRPLSAANRVSDTKISVFNLSYPSLTVAWMEVDSLNFMTDGFERPATEASNRSTLCTKHVRLP
jgi:hypothetical protein